MAFSVEIDCPAAWCWVPLQRNSLIADPDIEDGSPRYDRPPDGGWEPIGNAVIQVLHLIQVASADPLTESLEVVVDFDLTSEAEHIVGMWFRESEAPQCWPGPEAKWNNGRHRTWGLAQAGFDIAPMLNMSFGDAVHFWRPDPLGWPGLDREDLARQRERLHWWSTSPEAHMWRSINPAHAKNWGTVLDAWDNRLRRG